MQLFKDDILPPISLPDKSGYDIQQDDSNQGFRIKIPNGELFYSRTFFNDKISDRTLEYLLENNKNIDCKSTEWRSFDKDKFEEIIFKNILWQHDKISMYGKEIYLPRISAWYGDNDKPYTYSGISLQPKPWNKGLKYLKEKVSEVAKVQFNSVLLNWYRDGEDHISWHTDAEKELGKNPIIASANFGETRDFIIRRIDDHSEKLKIPLEHGTLLIMYGELQHYWQHSVPKRTTKKVNKSRVNLTFRIIK